MTRLLLCKTNKVPLHGLEIRAEKAHYFWMKSKSKGDVRFFKTELRDLVTSAPVHFQACFVDNDNYVRRFGPV